MPRQARSLRTGIAAAVFLALLTLPACKDRKPGPPEVQGPQGEGQVNMDARMSGKVTYKGEAVPYGYIVLYLPDRAIDPKDGTVRPIAVGFIQKDGTYKVERAPVGRVFISVVTDPNVTMHDLMSPSQMG